MARSVQSYLVLALLDLSFVGLLQHVLARRVVNQRELEQRAEDERQTDADPHVNRLRVRDWRQVRVHARCLQRTTKRVPSASLVAQANTRSSLASPMVALRWTMNNSANGLAGAALHRAKSTKSTYDCS